jgi:restriction endonuclease S subunit
VTLKLKDICEIDWGNTSLTKKAYEVDGEYLAVSATGADGKISHYEHEDDVCVLSAIGAQCGKMFFPQQRFTAIKNTITLTPKRELVNSKYLYHLFTHIKLPKRGAAQPFISKGDIEKFELPHLP